MAVRMHVQAVGRLSKFAREALLAAACGVLFPVVAMAEEARTVPEPSDTESVDLREILRRHQRPPGVIPRLAREGGFRNDPFILPPPRPQNAASKEQDDEGSDFEASDLAD